MVKKVSEESTRMHLINPALENAGWIGRTMVIPEYTYTDGRINVVNGSRGKQKRLDYLLCTSDKQPIAIIEAKAEHLSEYDGLQQVKEYRLGLQEKMNISFVYSTNGKDCVEYDAFTNQTRRFPMSEFPSPAELKERNLLGKKIPKLNQNILDRPYHYSTSDNRDPRYYQFTSVNRIMEAIARGEKRAMVVMATGVGKTYTAFQLSWRLKGAIVNGRKINRILFLADRNNLVDQAITDFSPFGENTVSQISNRKIEKSAEIHFGIYQQLTLNDNGVEKVTKLSHEQMNVFHQVSRSYFDLIIIDECHRGGVREDSSWREILDYFDDAIHIGLTATPKVDNGSNNYEYFGKPVYEYSLKDGIEDGFLAPYEVTRYFLSTEADSTFYHDKEEHSKNQIDHTIIIDHRREFVAKEVADYLKKHKNEGRIKKTIIFCQTIEHAAEMMALIANEMPGEMEESKGQLVARITSKDANAKELLGKFTKDSEPYPAIVTTSKMLTTGINVKMCEVIVIDSKIESVTEFKQILGRGTRLNVVKKKTMFTILDFKNATKLFSHEHFDGVPFSEEEAFFDARTGSMTRKKKNNDDEFEELKENDKKSGIKRISDMKVDLLGKQKSYIGLDGKTISSSYSDYLRYVWKTTYAETLLDYVEFYSELKNRSKMNQFLLKNLDVQENAEEFCQENSVFDEFERVSHFLFEKEMVNRVAKIKKMKNSQEYKKLNSNQQSVIDLLVEEYLKGNDKAFTMGVLTKSQKVEKIIPSRKLREELFGSDEALQKTLKSFDLLMFNI